MKYWSNRKIYFLIVLCSVILISYKNSDNQTILEDKEEIKVNRKQFGMYVENEAGEFVEYTDSELFPDSSMYTFNEEKSYCVDNKDNVLENVISYRNGKVTVTSNKTIYCTLYFDGLKDDLTLNVSTDGVDNVVPTSGIYKQTLNCSSGESYYNPYYQRLEIGGFKVGTKCDLKYTKDTTNYELLSSVVQNNATTNANGYRYSGTNPDNYVWFNNEMWRIIGLIPVCTSALSGTCSTRTNLVKIIRNESIGGLIYDLNVSTSQLWENNILYTLLNNYYYGKQDGTGTGYCYGYSSSAKSKCNYHKMGISDDSNDYYGKMVESVYWDIGKSKYVAIPSTIYGTEKAMVTTNLSKIGLMSASDYGYAAVVSGYSTNVFNYDSSSITGSNWLYGQGNEWTNIVCSEGGVLAITNAGYITGLTVNQGLSVRPSIYLKNEVYKISGTGTVLDPYMIGIK